MSEEQTQHLRNDNPILQQILTKLEVMDARVQFVETKITDRSYDTKPIWEQALSEIMEIKNRLGGVEQRLGSVEQRLGGVEQRLGGIEHELSHVKHEFGDVKRELALVNRKIDVFNSDMLKLRADQLSTEERLRHLEA